MNYYIVVDEKNIPLRLCGDYEGKGKIMLHSSGVCTLFPSRATANKHLSDTRKYADLHRKEWDQDEWSVVRAVTADV